ncbi:MAG: phosphatidate cytidylyltransferase [Flavobacterium sp.]|nr:phosphatidate cytidylyltransferase [Pedobacter sp.]
MKSRVITGVFFVTVMLISILSGPYFFSVFFLILSILSLDEFYRLFKNTDIRPNRILGFLLALFIFVSVILFYLLEQTFIYFLFLIPCIIIIIVSELYRKKQTPIHNMAYTIFGVLYTVVPFCFFYAMAFSEAGYSIKYPLGFLILLWSTDTGAYLFGIKFGKHKLFERHSPKKTWEGFAGGFLTSLLAAGTFNFFLSDPDLINWLTISSIIVISGSFGDLSESMLKRSLSVKDSGTILPGHGGLLDRFDGLFLAAPLVFVYLQIVKAY